MVHHIAKLLTRRPALAALFVVVAGLAVWAQAGGIEEARKRWRDLPEERRREIAERYENWRKLSPDERERLRERWRTFEDLRRGAQQALPDHVRGDLSKLPPHEQRQALSSMTLEQISERGRSVLDRLPREWRERVEHASPEQRREMFQSFKSSMHEKVLARLDEAVREGRIEADEAQRLRKADPCELGRRLVELEAHGFRDLVEHRGLPAYVSAEQWQAWKELPPSEMWRRFHDAKRSCEPREGHRDDHGPRGERGPSDERVHRLRECMKPEPSWYLETVGGSREAQFEALGARIRERLLEKLAETPDLVDSETLAKLRQLEGREFFEALSRALPELQPPWTTGGRWRGDKGKSFQRGPGGLPPVEGDGPGSSRPPKERGGHERSEPTAPKPSQTPQAGASGSGAP
ncbi:MAG: DUF3106 domain-containing protein [Planctomycetes bacterium]|nr:DUF3106 domain-containing protein [Planctomycetota bacterium]